MPAAMAPPGRANGLYVVVVGEGVCRPFLRGSSIKAAASIPQTWLPLEVINGKQACSLTSERLEGAAASRLRLSRIFMRILLPGFVAGETVPAAMAPRAGRMMDVE